MTYCLRLVPLVLARPQPPLARGVWVHYALLQPAQQPRQIRQGLYCGAAIAAAVVLHPLHRRLLLLLAATAAKTAVGVAQEATTQTTPTTAVAASAARPRGMCQPRHPCCCCCLFSCVLGLESRPACCAAVACTDFSISLGVRVNACHPKQGFLGCCGSFGELSRRRLPRP